MNGGNPTLIVSLGEDVREREPRWISIRQVEPPDESATLEQAAELIDALYGIDLCGENESGDMGTGGEAPVAEELPDRNTFLDLAQSRLSALCDESGWWTAEVDVLRSHRESGYSLESENCRIGETTIMRREVVEDVEMSGAAAHDLEWPYDGELRVSGAVGDGDVAGIAGSTVRFGGPVRGRVRLRYRALYDRVRIHVPTRRASNGAPQAEPAVVVAFWENLATQCELRRPAADDTTEARERERLCDPEHKYKLVGECWEEHERYDTCLCSGRDASTPVVEVVDAPCPEGTAPGAYLGKVRTRGETAFCAGEQDELNDPGYYEQQCCDPSPGLLPACRETHEPYQGGVEIERGPQYWLDMYGRDTSLIAVAPEDGLCGELIRRWRVEPRDCGGGGGGSPACPEPPPVLAEETMVAPGEPFVIRVSGGTPPYKWLTNAPVDDWDGTETLHFTGVPALSSWDVEVYDACDRYAFGKIVTPGLEPLKCWDYGFNVLIFGGQYYIHIGAEDTHGAYYTNGYDKGAYYSCAGDDPFVRHNMSIVKPRGFRYLNPYEESEIYFAYGVSTDCNVIHVLDFGMDKYPHYWLIQSDTDEGHARELMRMWIDNDLNSSVNKDIVKVSEEYSEYIHGLDSLYSEIVTASIGMGCRPIPWTSYKPGLFSAGYTALTRFSGYIEGECLMSNGDRFLVSIGIVFRFTHGMPYRPMCSNECGGGRCLDLADYYSGKISASQVRFRHV